MSKSEATPEIEAMATVEAALAPLEEDARTRVLRWASDRFGFAIRALGLATSALLCPSRPNHPGRRANDPEYERQHDYGRRRNANPVLADKLVDLVGSARGAREHRFVLEMSADVLDELGS